MDRKTFGINIANLIIRAAAVGVSAYSIKVMANGLSKGIMAIRKTEMEVNGAGKLLVVEYVNGRQNSVRYATKEEVWDYSNKRMRDELVRMGVL